MSSEYGSVLEAVVSATREATYAIHDCIRLARLEQRPSKLEDNVPQQQEAIASMALGRLEGVQATLESLRTHWELEAHKAAAILRAQAGEKVEKPKMRHNTTVRRVGRRYAAICNCGWGGPARMRRDTADKDAESHRKKQPEEKRGEHVTAPDEVQSPALMDTDSASGAGSEHEAEEAERRRARDVEREHDEASDEWDDDNDVDWSEEEDEDDDEDWGGGGFDDEEGWEDDDDDDDEDDDDDWRV